MCRLQTSCGPSSHFTRSAPKPPTSATCRGKFIGQTYNSKKVQALRQNDEKKPKEVLTSKPPKTKLIQELSKSTWGAVCPVFGVEASKGRSHVCSFL